MKIPRVETLISKGQFSQSNEWKTLRAQALDAVGHAEWPPGSGSFTIYPQSGKKSGEGNGVKPIKNAAIAKLTGGAPSYGRQVKAGVSEFSGRWTEEYPWPIGERIRPGNMDAAYVLPGGGYVCFEWETGNISSSHRSMNKMALGLLKGTIKAGLLVVPSRALYPYLTDRIGNVAELECQRRSEIGPRGGAKLGHFGLARNACGGRRPVSRALHVAGG